MISDLVLKTKMTIQLSISKNQISTTFYLSTTDFPLIPMTAIGQSNSVFHCPENSSSISPNSNLKVPTDNKLHATARLKSKLIE